MWYGMGGNSAAFMVGEVGDGDALSIFDFVVWFCFRGVVGKEREGMPLVLFIVYRFVVKVGCRESCFGCLVRDNACLENCSSCCGP